MITHWKFYKKRVVLDNAKLKTMWHEISHNKAQDLFYEAGIHRATPHIKRMMQFHGVMRVGNTLIKMEEMPNACD